MELIDPGIYRVLREGTCLATGPKLCHIRASFLGMAMLVQVPVWLLVGSRPRWWWMYCQDFEAISAVHSGKLTWQWKIISIFNREYIFKWSNFYCHVSLPKGSFWFLWTCRVSSLREFRSYLRFHRFCGQGWEIPLDFIGLSRLVHFLGWGIPVNLHFLRVLMGRGRVCWTFLTLGGWLVDSSFHRVAVRWSCFFCCWHTPSSDFVHGEFILTSWDGQDIPGTWNICL